MGFLIFKAYHVSEQDKISKHIFFICERVYYTNTALGVTILRWYTVIENKEIYWNIKSKVYKHAHYMDIVLVQLFVSCRVSCVNNITRRKVSTSVVVYITDETWYKQLYKHIYAIVIRLSNILKGQKMVILFI